MLTTETILKFQHVLHECQLTNLVEASERIRKDLDEKQELNDEKITRIKNFCQDIQKLIIQCKIYLDSKKDSILKLSYENSQGKEEIFRMTKKDYEEFSELGSLIMAELKETIKQANKEIISSMLEFLTVLEECRLTNLVEASERILEDIEGKQKLDAERIENFCQDIQKLIEQCKFCLDYERSILRLSYENSQGKEVVFRMTKKDYEKFSELGSRIVQKLEERIKPSPKSSASIAPHYVTFATPNESKDKTTTNVVDSKVSVPSASLPVNKR